MGEAVQKKKKNENEKNGDGGGGAGKKKEENPVTVVLKVDMHCEGCANKIIKCVKGFEGVQTVKAEIEANKLTVMGKKIDPSKLREKLFNKTKKKVDLISPQPKKEKDSKPNDDAQNNTNKSDKKTDEKKKPKEPPVTTAVLKVALHCQGCIEKIHRVTSKFKGVHEMSVERQKDLVTVKGTMDIKALSESLTERLKRPVAIIPAKKEKEKDNNNNKKNNNGDNKEAGGEGETKAPEGGGGGKKKKKGGGGGGGGNGGEEDGGGGGGKMEGNKMEYMGMTGYGYGLNYGYGYGYGPGGLVGENLHAPQIFSDENPNACSIM